MAKLYFEDIEEGKVRHLGEATVTDEEMVTFAQQYGPQPIHAETEGSVESSNGLTASGWYTVSVCMRLLVDEFLSTTDRLRTTGIDELVWDTPVHAGDTLTVENEILETSQSEHYDDYGNVRSQTRGYNQNGDEVVRWTSIDLIAHR